jgi:membrane protease YdiL (CAAX protease family)
VKFKILDILLFALLFVFVNAFPVDLFPLAITEQLIVRLCLRFVLLLYYIYLLWRYRINLFKFANYRRGTLFIPFVIICFSNLIAAAIAGSDFTVSINPVLLSLTIVYHLFGVIIEELLFRFFIQNSLVFASSIKRILASAGIFALFHLINIVNVSSVDALVDVLTQVVYAFGLGLLLGLIYEYTYSIPLCVVFHFIFNFTNLILVHDIFHLAIPALVYYLTAVICGLVVGVYAFAIYFFVLRRNDRYFRE